MASYYTDSKGEPADIDEIDISIIDEDSDDDDALLAEDKNDWTSDESDEQIVDECDIAYPPLDAQIIASSSPIPMIDKSTTIITTNDHRCSTCNQSKFESIDDLEVHIADKHCHYYAYQCELCEYIRFPTLYTLRKHMHDIHQRSEFNVTYVSSIEMDEKRDRVQQMLNESIRSMKIHNDDEKPIEFVDLQLVAANGKLAVRYRTNVNISMRQMMIAYAERNAIDVSLIRFLYKYRRIADDDTPKSLKLVDDDIIRVYQLLS